MCIYVFIMLNRSVWRCVVHSANFERAALSVIITRTRTGTVYEKEWNEKWIAEKLLKLQPEHEPRCVFELQQLGCGRGYYRLRSRSATRKGIFGNSPIDNRNVQNQSASRKLR